MYLVGIDIDRQNGIDAFCTRNGKVISLQDLASQTLVEQHEDAPDRCHVFFYSPFRFPVKRPDEILGIEVKSLWEHGLMRVAPSITEGGYPLKIIGAAREPVILNDLQANELLQHINHICIDNGVEYLQKANIDGGDYNDNSSTYLKPELRKVIKSQDVSFATRDKVKIESGYRNITLISVANSILFTHLDQDRTNGERLKDFFFAINYFLCRPPLGEKEVEAVWNSAYKWAAPRVLNEFLQGKKRRMARGKSQGGGKKKQEKIQEQVKLEKLIEELELKYHFKTLKDTSEIWYYKESKGIFVSNAEVVIKARLESEFGLEFSRRDVSEFLGHIERRTYFDRADFNPSIEWMPFEDCVVNLKTLETKPHSPDFLATVQIPVSYFYHHGGANTPIMDFYEWVGDTLSLRCPRIMKFMHQVMAPEDVETVLDIIAYCLWRDLPFHKYLLFNGSGRNGKGTMLAVIKAILGGQNVSGESLHKLLNSRFSTSKLYGKLANIHADLSNEALKDTGILKDANWRRPNPCRREV